MGRPSALVADNSFFPKTFSNPEVSELYSEIDRLVSGLETTKRQLIPISFTLSAKTSMIATAIEWLGVRGIEVESMMLHESAFDEVLKDCQEHIEGISDDCNCFVIPRINRTGVAIMKRELPTEGV